MTYNRYQKHFTSQGDNQPPVPQLPPQQSQPEQQQSLPIRQQGSSILNDINQPPTPRLQPLPLPSPPSQQYIQPRNLTTSVPPLHLNSERSPFSLSQPSVRFQEVTELATLVEEMELPPPSPRISDTFTGLYQAAYSIFHNDRVVQDIEITHDPDRYGHLLSAQESVASNTSNNNAQSSPRRVRPISVRSNLSLSLDVGYSPTPGPKMIQFGKFRNQYDTRTLRCPIGHTSETAYTPCQYCRYLPYVSSSLSSKVINRGDKNKAPIPTTASSMKSSSSKNDDDNGNKTPSLFPSPTPSASRDRDTIYSFDNEDDYEDDEYYNDMGNGWYNKPYVDNNDILPITSNTVLETRSIRNELNNKLTSTTTTNNSLSSKEIEIALESLLKDILNQIHEVEAIKDDSSPMNLPLIELRNHELARESSKRKTIKTLNGFYQYYYQYYNNHYHKKDIDSTNTVITTTNNNENESNELNSSFSEPSASTLKIDLPKSNPLTKLSFKLRSFSL
ncbi:hypothetical protein DFJ63DRAFT_191181 [Scheffersomyces coipomensis]|uniref:uncharacterized protein n=1 Tax=Scheffersomyces coipomensis TaxID=1788519 RepID=UPI00315DC70C